MEFEHADLITIALGLRVAAEWFENDASNKLTPEWLREHLHRRAERCLAIADRIKNSPYPG